MTNNAKNKTALIMAGGTGGHIFPALAVAQELEKQGWHIHWLGTANHMEAEIIPKYNYPLHFTSVQGVRRNGLKRFLSIPVMLSKSLWQALKIVKKVKPNIVIGFGGYASAPGGLAAKLLGVPLVIHEQNALLGMTNKYLSKIATHTFLAFNLSNNLKLNNSTVIGNPVRSDIASLFNKSKRILNKESEINILIFGGSLGAKTLNDTIPNTIRDLLLINKVKLNIKHQVGKGNLNNVHIDSETSKYYEFVEFIDDMKHALEWSDLAICRAGALTVSELAISGNIGIYVPLPHAVDDHQTKNAETLCKINGGILLPQSKIKTDLLPILNNLCNKPNLINEMQNNAKTNVNQNTLKIFIKKCNDILI